MTYNPIMIYDYKNSLSETARNICFFLNDMHTIDLAEAFIYKQLDKYIILEEGSVKKRLNMIREFTQTELMLKNIFGLSFENLLIISNSYFVKQLSPDESPHSNITTTLIDKISTLEQEIEAANEIIEELRESYIRLKRA